MNTLLVTTDPPIGEFQHHLQWLTVDNREAIVSCAWTDLRPSNFIAGHYGMNVFADVRGTDATDVFIKGGRRPPPLCLSTGTGATKRQVASNKPSGGSTHLQEPGQGARSLKRRLSRDWHARAVIDEHALPARGQRRTKNNIAVCVRTSGGVGDFTMIRIKSLPWLIVPYTHITRRIVLFQIKWQ